MVRIGLRDCFHPIGFTLALSFLAAVVVGCTEGDALMRDLDKALGSSGKKAAGWNGQEHLRAAERWSGGAAE